MRSVLVIGLLLAALNVYSQEESLQFAQANQAYRSGDFSKAAELYEQIARNGYRHPSLFYNLGNSYYKLKNIPAAILNYERAKRLAPRDEDIAYNLRLANLRIVDKIEPIPQLFFAEWWNAFLGELPSAGWAVVIIAALWLAVVAGSLVVLLRSVVIRRISLAAATLFLLCAVVGIVGATQQLHNEQNTHDAVVFTPSAAVKSAPDEKSTDLFVLHEGVKIELLDSVGDWVKIRLADGKVGWLPLASAVII